MLSILCWVPSAMPWRPSSSPCTVRTSPRPCHPMPLLTRTHSVLSTWENYNSSSSESRSPTLHSSSVWTSLWTGVYVCVGGGGEGVKRREFRSPTTHSSSVWTLIWTGMYMYVGGGRERVKRGEFRSPTRHNSSVWTSIWTGIYAGGGGVGRECNVKACSSVFRPLLTFWFRFLIASIIIILKILLYPY